MELPKKIKVAYFFPNLANIATARCVENFANNHNKAEFDVSFVGGRIEENFKNEIQKNIFVSHLNNFYAPGLFLKLIGYYKKEQPDIFVSAFPHINIIVVVAKIISGSKIKIVLTEHNNFSFFAVTARSSYRRFVAKFILPRFMRILYPLADAIICVSKGVAEDLSKVINYKGKIEVIYNPVVSDKIYNLSKEPLNHPWFLNLKIPVILAAGRFVRQKDYPTLLKAFKLVIQRKSVRLVILGGGAERTKLEKLIQELGISENIALLGFQKNPYKYMKNASVFVLSSLEEGLGNVIIEAMALGTPVVSTNCKSGPGEIIENGKNGILVPVGDYKSLSEEIIKVLDDSSLRQALSEEGAKRAEYFSVERSIKEYERVFKKIMDKI